jgi:hypothetical protein
MAGYEFGSPSLVVVVAGAVVVLRVAGDAEGVVDVANVEGARSDGPGEDDMVSLQPPDLTRAGRVPGPATGT